MKYYNLFTLHYNLQGFMASYINPSISSSVGSPLYSGKPKIETVKLCSEWANTISSFINMKFDKDDLATQFELEALCQDISKRVFEQIDAQDSLSLLAMVNLIKASFLPKEQLCKGAAILIARFLFHSCLQPQSFYPNHAFYLIIEPVEHLNASYFPLIMDPQGPKDSNKLFSIIAETILSFPTKLHLIFCTNYVNICSSTAFNFQSVCFIQYHLKLAYATDLFNSVKTSNIESVCELHNDVISNESYMLLNQFFSPFNIDDLLSYSTKKKSGTIRAKAIKELVAFVINNLDLNNPTSLVGSIAIIRQNYLLRSQIPLHPHSETERLDNISLLLKEFSKVAFEKANLFPAYLKQVFFCIFPSASLESGFYIRNEQQLKAAILNEMSRLKEEKGPKFSVDDYLSQLPADFSEELHQTLNTAPLNRFDITPLIQIITEGAKRIKQKKTLILSKMNEICLEISKNLLATLDLQTPLSLSQDLCRFIDLLSESLKPFPLNSPEQQITDMIRQEITLQVFQQCLSEGRSSAYLDQAYSLACWPSFTDTDPILNGLTDLKQLQQAIFKQMININVLLKVPNALKSVGIRHCLELLPPNFFSASQTAYCKKALSDLDSPSLPSEFYPISKDENTKTPPTQQPRPTRKSTKKTNISRIDTSLQASSSGNLVPSPSSSRTVASPAKTPVINPIPKEPRLPKRLKPASQPIQAASIILEPLFIPATAPALSMDNLVSRLEIVDADTYEKLRKDIKKFPKKERLVFYEKTAAILVEKKHPLALAIISRKFKDSNKRDTLLLKIVSSYRNTKIREKALESIFDKQLKEMASTLHLAALQQRNSYTRESVVQRPTLLRQTSMFLPRIASADSSNIAEPSSSNSRSRSNSAAVQGSGHDPFSNQDRRFYCPSHEFKGQTFSYGNLRGIIQAEAEKYGFISSWADGHGDHKLLKLFSEEGIPRDCDCSIPHHVDMKEGVARTYTLNALASVRKAADKLGLWKPASE